MSKQDGVAVRSAADLERKWQFGKQFAEVLGLVDDARGAITEIDTELRDLVSATSIARTAEQIIMTALKEYTDSDELGEAIKKKFATEFEIAADGIRGAVTQLQEDLNSVDDDLQTKYNLITKYFTFDINGLLIGAVDEEGNPLPNKVIIDNDDITIEVNGKAVVTLKADGTSEIPSLSIAEQLKVCGLSITEDDTHINCDYVG